MRLQIGITLLVLTALTVALIGVVVLNLMEQSLTARERSVGEQALGLGLDRLERELVPEEPLDSESNLEVVTQIARALVDSGLVDRVDVFTAGDRIAVYPQNLPPLDITGPRSGQIDADHVTHPELGPLIVASGPIQLAGREMGTMRTVHSTVSGASWLRSAQLLIGLYTLLAAVLAVIVGYVLLTRIIVAPIRRIGVATKRIAEGDHASRVSLRSQNEIGWLAQNVNHMLDRLDSGRRELRQKIDALAQANAELEDAQEAMIRSEKLASIGQLAAGVAHEVGNPLSAVIGLVELLQDDPSVPSEQREDVLRRIEKELMRINQIIRDLLDYSRTPDEEAQDASLQLAVSNTLKLVEAQPTFRTIDVKVSMEEQLPLVAMNNDRLVQVLLNLLLNAAEAMDGEGTITVTARREVGEVRLSVEDNGPGIDAEAVGRVFEPFFTTKPPGKGTGLGLAICERIVETAGGTIEVTNLETGGARFALTLPMT